jgi:hypothetical protein
MRATYISGFLIFFSLLGLARAGEPQKSIWKGKIEKKDGVTIVSNPKNPLYPSEALRLEEDLTIGETGGGKDYAFNKAWFIAVDEAGAIYVMDQGDTCVKVFDESGKYLRSIGRKGEGPGELQNPNGIHIINGQRLVFEDFIRSLSTFSTEGRFIGSLSTAKLMPLSILVTPENKIVVFMNAIFSGQKGKEIRIYDGQLNFIKTLLFVPDEPRDPQVVKPFAAGFDWAVSQSDRLAISRKEDYEIDILDLKGNSSTIFKRDCDRIKITKAEIDDMTSKIRKGLRMDSQKYHPAIQGISADNEGRIYVKTFERTKDGEYFYYDVFDRDGRYLIKVPIPRTARSLVWKNGRMYCLEEDAEGFQKVKRYRVIWQIPN